MKNSFSLLLFFLLTSFCLPQKKTTVWLVGDSTMSNKEVRAYPETGWGMPFSHFFDSTIVVENRAKNGRSTKTFLSEGLWDGVMHNMQKDDIVFIQFGHNDEVSTKASYTTESEFKNNLTKYISDTRSKKATPILITPVARRKFDSLGKVIPTHQVYSEIVRTVAKKNKVQLIDLDKMSQEVLQNLGPETSKLLFNHLEREQHPNYPEGKVDDTHFSELGARKMAQLVLSAIRTMDLSLKEHIAPPFSKK